MKSSASHPSVCPKTVHRAPIVGARVSTQFAQQSAIPAVKATPLVCCVYNNYHRIHAIVDNFIKSQCLFDLIISYHSVCEDMDNMSDHSPLYLCLNIDPSKFECNTLKFKPRKNGTV